jgi:surface antigen
MLVAFAFAAPAHAVTITGATTKLVAGGTGKVIFNAGAGPRTCEVTARAGKSRLGPLRYKVAQPLVAIAGKVPRDAATLTWSVSVRCSSSAAHVAKARGATTRIRIRGHRRGARVLFVRESIHVRSYPADASVAPEPGRQSGGKGGYVCASAWDGYRSVLDASSYCSGYCTWFVWQKRPEAQLKNLGNAWEWYGGAKARGIPVGSTPVVGAIAWWGISSHAPEGHVAYVVAVSGSSVTVAEMNHIAWGVEDTRTLSGSGLPNGYIYGGPAGNGSGSGSGSGGPGPGSGGTGPGNEPTGLDDVYFVGTDGRIHVWLYSGGTGWTEQNLGGSVATGTSPSAFENASGAQYVYFVGTDGRIHVWLYSGGTGWTVQNLGGSVATGTSPSAFGNSSGDQYVYFVGTDGRIHVWLYSGGTGWTEQNLGGSVASGASPSAFENASGDQYVYFVGSDTRIHVWLYSGGTGWTEQNLGGSVASGTSPSAFENSSGAQYVYFVGTDGRIHVRLYSGGTGWTEQNLGGSVASGTSPSAYENASGDQYVYFVGTDGRIHVWLYSGGTGWTEQNLGGSVAGGTSPSGF